MSEGKKRGLFTPYSSSDPSMDVPVTAGPAGKVISPYMNFDPAYIPSASESQFIFPEGANRNRGRLEMSFSQIGGSIMAGAAYGGVSGLYAGFRQTKIDNQIGKIRQTVLLNYISKRGASTAQSLGVIALMYSLIGVGVWYARGQVEDEVNTVTAATATGLLYKSSAGWQKCLRGGAIGFGLATLYCLFTSKDRIKSMLGKD